MEEIKTPEGEPVITTIDGAIARAKKIGYPILVRPWGCDENAGKRYHIVNTDGDLRQIFKEALDDSVNDGRIDMSHISPPRETQSYIPTPK